MYLLRTVKEYSNTAALFGIVGCIPYVAVLKKEVDQKKCEIGKL